MIREMEPPKPSARLSMLGEKLTEIAVHRQTEAKKLTQSLRGELDWIVLKTMEKDRTRRYETADALQSELKRYLNDEPIAARPVSTFYRGRKFVRRHKMGVAAAAAIMSALVLGIIGTSLGLVRARFEQGKHQAAEKVATEQKIAAEKAASQARLAQAEAEREAARSKAINDFMRLMLASAGNSEYGRGREVRLVDVLDGASHWIDDKLKNQPLAEIDARLTLGETYQRLALRDEAVQHTRQAHLLAHKLLGDDAEQTIVAAGALAAALGDEPLARDAYRRAIEKLGQHHEATQKIAGHLAVALLSGNRGVEAEELLRDLLAHAEKQKKTLGETAELRSQLALSLQSQGKFAQAEAGLRQIARISTDPRTQGHVWRQEVNLAKVLVDQGTPEKLEQAKAILKDTLDQQ